MRRAACVLLWALSVAVWAGTPPAQLQALLGNTAVLEINGQRKVLRLGESFAGVSLVATDAATATIDYRGQRHTLGLSQRVGTVYHAPQQQQVTVVRDARNQYRTTATINGRPVQVLVDTGANVVALSAAQASALGIDFSAAASGVVETASGKSNAYLVMLDSVSVGAIRVDRVEATVVEGDYPATVLLGMSFLRHVSLKEENGVLSLSRTR